MNEEMKRVRELMQATRTTRGEMASAMGVTRQAVTQYLKGQAAPQPERVDRAMAFLQRRVKETLAEVAKVL